MRWLRLFVAILLAVAVPFQGALAVSVAPCMPMQQHEGSDGHAHASHDGHAHSHPQSPQPNPHHDKSAGSHCSPCGASAAIAGPVNLILSGTAHDAVTAPSALPPLGDFPSRLDRPPLAL